MRLFAINKKADERMPITDLYWFEEEGVHDFAGETYEQFRFELELDSGEVVVLTALDQLDREVG